MSYNFFQSQKNRRRLGYKLLFLFFFFFVAKILLILHKAIHIFHGLFPNTGTPLNLKGSVAIWIMNIVNGRHSDRGGIAIAVLDNTRTGPEVRYWNKTRSSLARSTGRSRRGQEWVILYPHHRGTCIHELCAFFSSFNELAVAVITIGVQGRTLRA